MVLLLIIGTIHHRHCDSFFNAIADGETQPILVYIEIGFVSKQGHSVLGR